MRYRCQRRIPRPALTSRWRHRKQYGSNNNDDDDDDELSEYRQHWRQARRSIVRTGNPGGAGRQEWGGKPGAVSRLPSPSPSYVTRMRLLLQLHQRRHLTDASAAYKSKDRQSPPTGIYNRALHQARIYVPLGWPTWYSTHLAVSE